MSLPDDDSHDPPRRAEKGRLVIQVTPSGEKIFVFMLGETLDTVIGDVLIVTLENNGGNRVHTARALGVSVRTVRNWIKKYHLGDDDDDEDPTA